MAVHLFVRIAAIPAAAVVGGAAFAPRVSATAANGAAFLPRRRAPDSRAGAGAGRGRGRVAFVRRVRAATDDRVGFVRCVRAAGDDHVAFMPCVRRRAVLTAANARCAILRREETAW